MFLVLLAFCIHVSFCCSSMGRKKKKALVEQWEENTFFNFHFFLLKLALGIWNIQQVAQQGQPYCFSYLPLRCLTFDLLRNMIFEAIILCVCVCAHARWCIESVRMCLLMYMHVLGVCWRTPHKGLRGVLEETTQETKAQSYTTKKN